MSATEESVGQSIEDAAEGDQIDPNEQLTITGSRQQLSLDAGGDPPETATVKLRGRSLPLEGEFEKGEHVALWIEGRIGEVHAVDRVDKYDNVTGTERRHIMVVTRVQRA